MVQLPEWEDPEGDLKKAKSHHLCQLPPECFRISTLLPSISVFINSLVLEVNEFEKNTENHGREDGEDVNQEENREESFSLNYWHRIVKQ